MTIVSQLGDLTESPITPLSFPGTVDVWWWRRLRWCCLSAQHCVLVPVRGLLSTLTVDAGILKLRRIYLALFANSFSSNIEEFSCTNDTYGSCLCCKHVQMWYDRSPVFLASLVCDSGVYCRRERMGDIDLKNVANWWLQTQLCYVYVLERIYCGSMFIFVICKRTLS